MSKIYCIECLETGEKYIGSTKKKYLSSRISEHKSRTNLSVSRYIIERCNWKYELLEEVDESQRLIREQYYIDTTDDCINKNRAIGLTQKEYLELNKDKLKDYKKDWNQLNKDKIKGHNKEYYQLNKDKAKEYAELNKDKIKEYQKEYHKYKCSWGGDPRTSNNLLLIDTALFADK